MIGIERVAVTTDGAEVLEISKFVSAHPCATAYATPTWLAAMGRFMGVAPRYHTATLDGRLVGILPIGQRPLHARAAFLPEQARPVRSESLGHDCYAGPLISTDLDSEARGRVLRALIESLDEPRNVLTTLFPPAWADLDEVRGSLVSEHGFRAVRGYPIGVKPLTGLTEAKLPSTYCKAHRNAADAAKRRGVVVSPAEGVGEFLEFCDLLDETLDRAGVSTGYSKDFIVEAGQELVRQGLGELFLGRVDGRSIAGVFMLHTSRSACYWLGATAKDERALKFRPMNAILPRAFSHAIALGCEWFELGGLMTEGLRTFKTGWGALEFEQPIFERSIGNLAEPLREARASAVAFVRRQLSRA